MTVALEECLSLPSTGLGLWKVPQDVCADTVYQAIKLGYRLLDGACDYGNEVEAGKGVARAIAEGIVDRKDLFIISKLWATYHGSDHVGPACQRSLRDWGLEYFDLYLVHFPVPLKYVSPKERYPPGWFYDGKNSVQMERSPLHLTWKALERLHSDGLIRRLGVCNTGTQLLNDILSYCDVPPSVLQIELHPYLVQADLVKLCSTYGIQVMAYMSFGPQSFEELNSPKCKMVDSLLTHPLILSVAKRHSRSTAQVLLRWSTQRQITVIPKSTNVKRLAENLGNTEFELEAEEIEQISALNKDFRFVDPGAMDTKVAIFA